MPDVKLSAKSRSERGSGASKRIRRDGMVPAIVYGGAAPAVSVTVDPRVIYRLLRSEAGRNTILSLDVDGDAADSVILKDWQVDPVRDTLLHADFQRIAMDQLLKLTVPIAFRGEAYGVKTEGGLLDVVLREIEVECLPRDIPERFEFDVSELKMNESVRVRDLPPIEGVKVLEEPDRVLVHVVAVREEVEPTAEAVEGEEAEVVTPEGEAEPEVIAKGKKEEEGD
jgi:large subunit ribosomal protein L25